MRSATSVGGSTSRRGLQLAPSLVRHHGGVISGGDFTHLNTVCKYLVRYHVLVFVVLTLLLVYLHCRISLSCPAIQCMQCSLHVSLEMVRALLSAEPTHTKYHSLALAEFVQVNL